MKDNETQNKRGSHDRNVETVFNAFLFLVTSIRYIFAVPSSGHK